MPRKPIIIELRKIRISDVSGVKTLADANRVALGFTPKKKLEEIAEQQRGFVAIIDGDVVGFVIFRHRKLDLQTTLSEICVHQDFRQRHVGKMLITELVQDCHRRSRHFIQLKCPIDLAANGFYQRLGFILHTTEAGKKRNLNVWRLAIQPSNQEEA